MKDQAVDATITSVATKATYAGSASAVLGATTSSIFGLTVSDFAMIGGLVVAAVGLVVNWYYRAKEDRRKARSYESLMREIRKREAAHDASILASRRKTEFYDAASLDPELMTARPKRNMWGFTNADDTQ